MPSAQLLTRLLRLRLFGKSPVAAFLRFNQSLWKYLPASATVSGPIRLYGDLLNAVCRSSAYRTQNTSTFFFRNRPELDLIRRLAREHATSAPLKIVVFGCSVGAELYSITWAIRTVHPDLKVVVNAVDISQEALDTAREGIYSEVSDSMYGSIVSRLSDAELRQMFDREGDLLRIKPLAREGITWHQADASDPSVTSILDPADIVIANRFLCHMDPPDADRTLRNIARTVRPGGYLFVSGVDLNVRTKVAQDLEWQPVTELLEDIHDGDTSLRDSWPCSYWGLEPFTKKRRDWRVRYTSAFRVAGLVALLSCTVARALTELARY